MPIPRYRLDDRNFNDLVAELVARIPAHTPEWTNPKVGDPGRTLIDLFAWLGDTILYRVNLLPERQRLEFLRLLNIPMRPAQAATGLVSLVPTNKKSIQPIYVPQYTRIKGVVDFETAEEISVLPVTGMVFVKRRPSPAEGEMIALIREELEQVYSIEASEQYITTPLYSDQRLDHSGFDFASDTIDQTVWMALLALEEDEGVIAQARKSFDPDDHGAKLINIGIEPRLKIHAFDDYVQQPLSMKELWQWEMPSNRAESDNLAYDIPYLTLDIKKDATEGFAKRGIVQLALPPSAAITLPQNSVDENIFAGTGNRPPRVDDEKIANRLVSWIRLRPKQKSASLALDWVGINAVKIGQLRTIRNVIAATASGAPDLTIKLPGESIEESSFSLQVEEEGKGFRTWQPMSLHMASSRDMVFELDSEAGTVRFGDGLRGAIPASGCRIRLECMRCGGGRNGNLAPGNLNAIAHPHLTVVQPIATTGGMDVETLDEAEKRIPQVLKHCHRAVTEDDYRQLASQTPGIELGRIEVLPRFKPQQRLFDIVGVISVMALPKVALHRPPNPRPDRNILSRVHKYLDERRPIGVELYVIGPEYIPLGVGVAITIREGFQKHQVLQEVKGALYDFLWPLAPGGHKQTGWPLGRTVDNQELAVIVARVAGVLTVEGVTLFQHDANKRWERVSGGLEHQMNFREWQFPELLEVAVIEDEEPVTDLNDFLNHNGDPNNLLTQDGSGGRTDESRGKVAIPVVPEICK
jgi:hypothetical protein